ncbi:MAG: PP2C family protein-serine/threonine phosphatase, partial [Bacteroidia bacterium]
FIFYLPKDVVSGDFYWFSEVESQETGVRSNETQARPSTPNAQLILAAADCTGHGVPGALMSIVSMDKLNQAVFEKKLRAPSGILQFLNVEIKKALKQHSDESKQKDGLDIALLKFDHAASTLSFAGANRPLYLVRNGQLTEYKSDKVAIAGFTPNEHVFSEQQIPFQKNDCIYVFSDGYADQFGGDSGKKFMTKNLKTLLESLSGQSIGEQERVIVDSHRRWKGNYEQVDDILVIGIKI